MNPNREEKLCVCSVQGGGGVVGTATTQQSFFGNTYSIKGGDVTAGFTVYFLNHLCGTFHTHQA